MPFLNLLLAFALALTVGSALAAEHAAPQSLEEAFELLDAELSTAEREDFQRKRLQFALADEHFRLGLRIRNEWLRAKGSKLAQALRDLGARSFDDASAMVLASYWRRLNGLPLDLEQQGACYRKWSEEQHRLEAEATAKGLSSYAAPSFSCSGA